MVCKSMFYVKIDFFIAGKDVDVFIVRGEAAARPLANEHDYCFALSLVLRHILYNLPVSF